MVNGADRNNVSKGFLSIIDMSANETNDAKT